MKTESHTDIKPDSKLVAFLPQAYRPYAYLARLDRPIGIWLLAFPGWWAMALAAGHKGHFGVWEVYAFVLFGLGAVIMRAAGCVINDIWDRDLDKAVERTRARPLAAGEISVLEAFLFLSVLLFAGFAILLNFNGATIILGFLALPLIALYPLMKRLAFWSQAFLGLVFNFGALMGWSALAGGLGVVPLLLYASCALWTLGYDTIYAFQDREDDALIGIKSTARLFGIQARRWVAAFYACSWMLLITAGFFATFNIFMPLFLIPAGEHLVWQMRHWRLEDAACALKVFQSNRDYGFLVLAGITAAQILAAV